MVAKNGEDGGPAYLRGILDRLPRVRDRIAAAAERTGRGDSSVRIVAVTKGHPAAAVEAALEAGLTHIGENRVEELERKVPMFGGRDVSWHMIGHVQRRKAARAAALAGLIHSVGSLRLAQRLSRIGEAKRQRVPALVQVNTSGEATKGGFRTEEALDGCGAVAELEGLRPLGLMVMAPFTQDEVTLRRTFRGAREILAAVSKISGFEARELSMGMSNDYAVAVEEGSTMVRLGVSLFGERPA